MLLALVAPLAHAQDDSWTNAKSAGKLLWGADQEGGGPFIYPRDDDVSRMTGFEVELAEAISKYLGVTLTYEQGQWDKLPDMLKAGKVDLVMNGYEWFPSRVEVMETSIPYYVYAQQLLVKKGSGIASWDAFKSPKADGSKWKVGVLTGSSADEHMKALGGATEIIGYDGGTDALREVENGKLDATLQDTPIVSFYLERFPQLERLGPPVAPGYYVIYVRQGDKALIEKINEAIIVLFRSETLQNIYTRYGMWNDDQKRLGEIIAMGQFFGYQKAVSAEVEKSAATVDTVELGQRKRGWDVVSTYGMTLVKSAGMTVLLALISFPIAVFIGLLVAVGRIYGSRWISVPLTIYVEFLRGTPLMLQLYFIFFLLPEVGVNIAAFPTAILGLAINYSAYESEIYRAGLQAIPGGQMEAALSLGMSRSQAIRKIVVPQAVRIVIPPVVNDFIGLFKDTSVCSVITIVELTKQFSILSLNTQATIEMMVMTGILYLAMSYPLSLLSRSLERRLAGVSA